MGRLRRFNKPRACAELRKLKSLYDLPELDKAARQRFPDMTEKALELRVNTAYHEAAHVMMGVALGARPFSVRISPQRAMVRVNTDDFREVPLLLAGPAAELMWRKGGSTFQGGGQDIFDAREWVAKVLPAPEVFPYLHRQLHKVLIWFATHWWILDHLAAAFILFANKQTGELNRGDLWAICDLLDVHLKASGAMERAQEFIVEADRLWEIRKAQYRKRASTVADVSLEELLGPLPPHVPPAAPQLDQAA